MASTSAKSLPTKFTVAGVPGDYSKNRSFAKVLQLKSRTCVEAKVGGDDLGCTVLQSKTRFERLGWSSGCLDPL